MQLLIINWSEFTMELINYRQLANREAVTNLFADYHSNFEKLAGYFSGNFKEKDVWEKNQARAYYSL